MKTYWVSWTFVANFSQKPVKVEAETPEGAADYVASWYAKEFREKATIYVYDTPPALVLDRGTPRKEPSRE